MKESLEQITSELNLQIRNLCKQLRKQAYKQGTTAHQNALYSLFYYQLLSDELTILLGRYASVKKALAEHGTGLHKDDLASDVYQFCLTQFEADNCPLGSSTLELKKWIMVQAGRQIQLRDELKILFPDAGFFTFMDQMPDDLASSSKGFSTRATEPTQPEGENSSLFEFNRHVLLIRQMLLNREPVESILNVFP